jgi:hypothetical protein
MWRETLAVSRGTVPSWLRREPSGRNDSCTSEPQPHEHEAPVTMVEHVDDDAAYRLGRVCPIGPVLAHDLIDDGMARAHPRFLERLVLVGLKVLDQPELPNPLAATRSLVRAADLSARSRQQVADGLRKGLR